MKTIDQLKGSMACCDPKSYHAGRKNNMDVTRPQLLERFKEESQVEDIGKGEGVRARSLTRSTKR